MGFADEVAIQAKVTGGKRSKYDEIREALGAEVDEFDRLLADSSVPAAAIARALQARGYEITKSAVQSWAGQRR